MIPDRMHQGMLNALCLMVLMKTGLAKDPNLIVNGNSVVDTSLRNYDGNRYCTHVMCGQLAVGRSPLVVGLRLLASLAHLHSHKTGVLHGDESA